MFEPLLGHEERVSVGLAVGVLDEADVRADAVGQVEEVLEVIGELGVFELFEEVAVGDTSFVVVPALQKERPEEHAHQDEAQQGWERDFGHWTNLMIERLAKVMACGLLGFGADRK